MNDTLSKVLIFTAGATIGSVVTWKLLDAKYAQRAEREIKDVEEYYKGKYSSIDTDGDSSEDDVIVTPDITEEDKKQYIDIVKNYTGEKGGSESMEIGTPPYVIPPEEFDTLDGYEAISLTYYTDGVLADDADYPIEDIENIVGKDFVNHFGEYEPDSVFIRNEMLKVDYEILMDYRPYEDVVQTVTNPEDDE